MTNSKLGLSFCTATLKQRLLNDCSKITGCFLVVLLDTKINMTKASVASVYKTLELITATFTIPGGQAQDITKVDWLNASGLNVHTVCLLSFCFYWLMYLFKHKSYKKAIPFW